MFKIMFLCTGNSCRSQMAEGFAREYGKDIIEVHSAGLRASHINPLAIEAMREKGIDISNQTSKDIDPDLLRSMNIVVTLCSHAEASCPVILPPQKRLHWPFDDPAKAAGSQEDIMNIFRKIRDDIEARIKRFIDDIRQGKPI